ncbi:hypothetical protein AQJ91_19195 [Streptomyces dysideae]|uniref:VOC domain-containing protein n=2 Tax=Streptomyces dysideae TaxID=909626 RepID=A0A101UZA9_9ACTN|nr:hypothetical protein AQJ91_19195 [Streptomyces dysideae]
MERFCREVPGCRVVHRSRIPESIGGPAGLGGELLVVWLRVPSGGRVKLILPQAAPVSMESVLPLAARQGLSYLTFHVEDLDPVVSDLVAAGATPLSHPVVVRARSRRISFWADPEGNAVELVDGRGEESGPGHSN